MAKITHTYNQILFSKFRPVFRIKYRSLVLFHYQGQD